MKFKYLCNLIKYLVFPEVKINLQWGLCTGENSKEFEVQTQRNRREIETVYYNVTDIPSNPKEPWDVEMDFDDSLTPEIPSEQLPDTDIYAGDITDHSQSQLPPENMDSPSVPHTVNAVPPTSGNGMLGPDLELLAVLLKNPDLVFALTSGQGAAMDAQTIALLDIVKNMGAANNETSTSVGENSSKQQLQKQESPATSLPSPTPPSERMMVKYFFMIIDDFMFCSASTDRYVINSLLDNFAVRMEDTTRTHSSFSRQQRWSFA